MHLAENLSKAIIYFLVFAAVATILSVWSGLFFLNTPIIFIASCLISYFLIKRFPVKVEKVPRDVLLLAIIVAMLCAHPLLLLHPFYPASNDAFHTIMVRVIQANEKIPQTFEPYSGVSFTYNFGFHLFAKLFADLFFFVPDYLLLWFFGVLFASVQVLLVYFFAKVLFNSERTGLYSALLFLGTKMIYQEMFFGIWPRLLATNLFFLYFIFLLKKHKFCLLFLPALACVHTGVFFNAAVFSFIYVLFNKKDFVPIVKTLPALVLALPSFVIVYSKPFTGIFAQSMLAEITPALLIREFVSVALWLGWVPLAVVCAGFFWMLYKRNCSKQKLFSLAVLIVFVLLYFYLFLKQYPSANVPMEFAGLGAVLFGSLTISEVHFKTREFEKWIKALIVVFCLLAFFASGYLTRLRFGSKISAEQAEFAFRFKQYDPALKETLFLTKGSSKMAEFANKIPYDVTQGFFLPFAEHILMHDEAYQKAIEKAQIQEHIISTKCIPCIYDLNVSYVVIDENYFPVKLNQSPVLEHGSIKLYKLGQ